MTETVRFRDLAIGDTFRFPETPSFSAICTKVSTRGYTWVGRMYDKKTSSVIDDGVLKTNVGTVNVVVERVTR